MRIGLECLHQPKAIQPKKKVRIPTFRESTLAMENLFLTDATMELHQQLTDMSVENLAHIKQVIDNGNLNNSLVEYLKISGEFESLIGIQLPKVTKENHKELSVNVSNKLDEIISSSEAFKDIFSKPIHEIKWKENGTADTSTFIPGGSKNAKVMTGEVVDTGRRELTGLSRSLITIGALVYGLIAGFLGQWLVVYGMIAKRIKYTIDLFLKEYAVFKKDVDVKAIENTVVSYKTATQRKNYAPGEQRRHIVGVISGILGLFSGSTVFKALALYHFGAAAGSRFALLYKSKNLYDLTTASKRLAACKRSYEYIIKLNEKLTGIRTEEVAKAIEAFDCKYDKSTGKIVTAANIQPTLDKTFSDIGWKMPAIERFLRELSSELDKQSRSQQIVGKLKKVAADAVKNSIREQKEATSIEDKAKKAAEIETTRQTIKALKTLASVHFYEIKGLCFTAQYLMFAIVYNINANEDDTGTATSPELDLKVRV